MYLLLAADESHSLSDTSWFLVNCTHDSSKRAEMENDL